MSLSEVHNPQAAAEMLEKFRKRFNTKTCMAPQDNHHGSIVSAHTLSVESMLRKISVDAHVYSIGHSKLISRTTSPMRIQRLGLRDVSVFNGFCQKHDAELFQCLDMEPYRFSPKQNFMLAYRAVARECYLKRKSYESMPTPEEYGAIHGIEGQLRHSDETIIWQAATLKGAEEVEALKATFDKLLLQESWGRLHTKAIIFPKMPTILATCTFQPFFDMNGNQLQDFENLQVDMSQLCMSLIPLEIGGAAIFSWLDTANSAPERFFKSVIDSSNINSSVIHAILDTTENIAFNPGWYESLTKDQKDYIFSRISIFDNTIGYSRSPRPELKAPYLDDWGQATVTSF